MSGSKAAGFNVPPKRCDVDCSPMNIGGRGSTLAGGRSRGDVGI